MLKRLSPSILLLTSLVIQFLLFGCSHKLSSYSEKLPEDIKVIVIPLFKNHSTEPGTEVFFTNALKTEVLKSRVIRLTDNESEAEGVLSGKIVSVDVLASESVIRSDVDKYLPYGSILGTSYKVTVTVDLQLKKRGSDKVLWSSNFKQSLDYANPQITLPVINTANNLYNYSAKRQTLDAIAKELMQAAFDRMLENF